MARSTQLLKSKDTYSREALADLLATLAEKIRAGTVTFDQAGTSLEIPIPESLRVDIEIKDEPKRRGGTKRELEIEMWWLEGAEGELAPTGGVTIS